MDIMNLTKSKIRKALLELYFSNPDKKYYLRELSRLLKSSVQNIRREMIKLAEMGVFKAENVGNLKFYLLNKDLPYFKELKGIISKTIGIEYSLKAALRKIDGIESAFIFGSFAKGKEKISSDIDLMIIGNPNEDEIVRGISNLEGKIGREINYHLFDLKEWNKKKKTDSFIQAIIKGEKIKLI